MKKYEYLEHTADAKFKAYGKTLESAFSNSALAVFNIIVDTKKVDSKIKKEIKLSGKNKESLLFDFLDELLFFLDSENFILHEVLDIEIINKNDEFLLSANVVGDEINEKYEVAGIVKAITYNEMEIIKKNGSWVITAVVDR
ncbi:MAG: archease [Candidatus Aenigmarchaeota archaeon]|nr:archease [Candidatus Aenigmarchaeota archaeon]